MEHQTYAPENASLPDSPALTRQARWALPAAIAPAGVAAFGVGYGLRQQSIVSQMTARQNENSAQVAQMRTQIDTLAAKLSEALASPQQAQQPQPAGAPEVAAERANPAAGPHRGRVAGSGKQINQLRAQLSDQQKQLKDTREALAQTRTDLETSLSATRDDLKGSIARTHEEVVALAKRGERNYSEFYLVKHAGFERSGPVSLSLRKADTKHQRFDLNLIVDDTQLSKKSVNLYEPIWIHRGDDPQPIQIVINKIEHDHVHGYVSSPKYRQSELTDINYSTPANTPTPNANGSSERTKDAPASTPGTTPNKPPEKIPPND